VLITDHNVRETLDICDRGYIISAGTVIAAGNPADLLANQQVRDGVPGSGLCDVTPPPLGPGALQKPFAVG
jgi:ABC-type lipopolysaccharide export system ATPase subunit